MASLKQIEPAQIAVGEFIFYIRPLPAFRAANLSGELANVLTPIFAGLMPLIGEDDNNKSLMDIDVEKEAPNIAKAFDGISGDKIEKLLRTLLISQGTIGVEITNEQTGQVKVERLNEDLANEIFCGEVQNMFILAFHAIKLNYNGFFEKLSSLFGSQARSVMEKMGSQNMESSTTASSVNSN